MQKLGSFPVLLFLLFGLNIKGQHILLDEFARELRRISKISPEDLSSHGKLLAELDVPRMLYQNVGQFPITGECDEDIWSIAKGMLTNESWATPWLDACGKPPPGIMIGALNWFGSYDMCLKNTINSAIPVGRYCTLSIPAKLGIKTPVPFSLHLGLCVPNSCNKSQIVRFLNKVLSNFSVEISETASYCQRKSGELEKDGWFWIAITLCAVLGLMLVIGTITELWLYVRWTNLYTSTTPLPTMENNDTTSEGANNTSEAKDHTEEGEHQPVEGVSVVTAAKYPVMSYVEYRNYCIKQYRGLFIPCAYSLPFNTWKLWTSKCPQVRWPDGVIRDHPLACLDGIRFLTMTWIIFGHYMMIITEILSNNVMVMVDKFLNRWTFQVLLNSTVSVDTFFFMSGLLTIYLNLNSYRKIRGWAKKAKFWAVFVVHRFVRLTPLYMFVLIVYTGLFTHLYDGPVYDQEGTTSGVNVCKENWYITYLNTLIKPTTRCMDWTWYLADDFQFTVVLAPIFISLIVWNRPTGIVYTFLLIVSAAGAYFGMAYVANYGYYSMDDEFLGTVYGKPYARWGTYAMGMILGWILLDFPNLPIRRTWRNVILVPAIGLGVASALCLSVEYGLAEVAQKWLTHDDVLIGSLYNALSRPAFILGVAIIVYLCATRWAEPYRWLLGWSGFRIVARLTYGAFMIHTPIQNFCIMGSRSAVVSDEVDWTTGYIIHVVLAYLGAYVLAVVTELPVAAMEKYIRGRA
ncbi:unnamed protein product [Calicophoron daubneyi]|uniref:Nose resistant-to-fluoxetine protein N-terminal domain-containing protein n=1 Tax=Calicophoron daubneyi TaxID=300641 RepID=A0AAV2TAT8_CALDB